MAIYHLHAQIIGRGRSSIACAAYRSTSKLVDRKTGMVFDYTRKKKAIAQGVLYPAGCEQWTREELWNSVEEKEKRINSQFAREIDIALPAELTEQERENAVIQFCTENFLNRGLICDYAIHEPDRKGSNKNFHSHIMITTRKVDKDGWTTKDRDANKIEFLKEVRKSWEMICNKKLSEISINEHIDCRTLEAQGIDREPQQHQGVTATQMERRGLEIERKKTTKKMEIPKNTKAAKELDTLGAYYRIEQKRLNSENDKTLIQHNIEMYKYGLGGREFVDNEKFVHHVYLNSNGIKNIYGLETKGKIELTPDQEAALKEKYNKKYLPVFPAAATLRGVSIDPQKAFDMINQNIYYDVHNGKLNNLVKGEQTLLGWANDQKKNPDLSAADKLNIDSCIFSYNMKIESNIINAKNDLVRDSDMNQTTAAAQPAQRTEELTPEAQLESLIKNAIENDKVPWQKPFAAGERDIPHNPIRDTEYSGTLKDNNLIAAVLHMENIGSKDPRYVCAEDFDKSMLKENAVPLKLAVMVKDKTTGKLETVTKTFYNGKDIDGIKEYVKKPAEKTINDVISRQGGSAKEQFTNDMAGFVEALKNQTGFVSKADRFNKTDYDVIKSADFNTVINICRSVNAIVKNNYLEKAQRERRIATPEQDGSRNRGWGY
ncbi:MAG: hypothetical protein Ta2C_10690 [Candidatus Endomicrobiellum trichonymphae]|uniref:MobQ family relaxase n=1 Tax=Endomicrobium trichonymphae TaxID=1408204 RepID=UPI0027D42AF0|nr:MAG: hypothetical protein Ta2C_10690 [Candidatus Endomicrobium trichonymphae]